MNHTFCYGRISAEPPKYLQIMFPRDRLLATKDLGVLELVLVTLGVLDLVLGTLGVLDLVLGTLGV